MAECYDSIIVCGRVSFSDRKRLKTASKEWTIGICDLVQND